MKIKVDYVYDEPYLPSPRHRVPRIREASGTMTLNIRETTSEKAPIAFRTWFQDTLEETYRWYGKKLYRRMTQKDISATGSKEDCLIDQFIEHCNHPYIWHYEKDEDVIKMRAKVYAQQHLLIDGVLWQLIGEPRYLSITFGLGRNHGGTALMIDHYYNPNISNRAYFSALQREEAVKDAKDTAIGRGDTDYVKSIGYHNIEVLIPEAVKVNPKRQHVE